MTEPKWYLNRAGFAKRIGVKPDTLNGYDLPDADILLEGGERPVRGWMPETVDAWQAGRRGQGWAKKAVETPQDAP